MKLSIYPMNVKVLYENGDSKEKIIDLIKSILDVEVENYRFTYMYTHFGQIPMHHFYDEEKDMFATGLLDTVKESLTSNNINYTIEDKRPNNLFSNDDILLSPITLGGRTTEGKYSYQMDAINSIISSADGKGILNLAVASGKTFLFSALSKIALPHLNSGEHIIFFTSSKDIFKQSLKEVGDMTGQEIGYYASGKFLDRPIMVVMLQSAYALLKIDPMKGVKLTPKERDLKQIKEFVIPRVFQTPHVRTSLKAYVKFMRVQTKADEKRKQELENIVDTTGSDEEVKKILQEKSADYDKRIKEKTQDSQDKKDFIVDLLQSAVFICQDECQHLTSDTFYKVITSCNNALVTVGLSGSLNPDDELLQRRVHAAFGRVTFRRRLEDNIKQGVSVPPIIHMLTVADPVVLDKDYLTVYDKGIVHNDIRNNLIADIIEKKAYPSGRVSLIIVNQIEHGEIIKEMLEKRNVPVVFINGTTDDDTRKKEIQKMRESKNRVVIATSIFDEGIDVKSIKVLVMAAAGKSYRTTIQRIGRSVRLGNFSDAHVFDFYDEQHFFLQRQSKERTSIYLNQGLEVRRDK